MKIKITVPKRNYLNEMRNRVQPEAPNQPEAPTDQLVQQVHKRMGIKSKKRFVLRPTVTRERAKLKEVRKFRSHDDE